jgi:phosphoglycolate phosphatase-like HAD superfamily hydrolase
MNPVTTIFYDFDGVIMDSMHLKLESYSYALEDYSFSRDELHEIQLRLAGLSRYEVMKTMVHELTGIAPAPNDLKKMGERFAVRDDELIPQMKHVPGSLDFIKATFRTVYSAVISGTPQRALEATLDMHNLKPFFSSINGSPEAKAHIANRLLSENGLDPSEAIFIGDGKTDQEASEECRIRFIGLKRDGFSFAEKRSFMTVSNLTELLSKIHIRPNKRR